MSQGTFCPNLSQKVQKKVSEMANHNLPIAMLYRWFKCKLKPPKNKTIITFYENRSVPLHISLFNQTLQ